ncbi:hypothetical protein GCM10010911_38490 [Paenibacillus nasutitermitis]|uniref:Uncharacterized protein n=2 Tax=Paenibacillus nasutitermitis TaxID=1652958 RepID=A0A917DWE7_9BACL|nr:hypothetical protein GCM10010911_38490 [Paenibacillus nasutitermitis]
MPIVLMVIIFFICLIQLCAVQMALHGAASQTVRQAAANIRPVQLASAYVSEHLPSDEPSSSRQPPLPGITLIADKLQEWLPSPAGLLMSSVLTGDWKPVENAVATEVARAVVEPMLRREADQSILDPELLKLSLLSLPDLEHKTEPYLRIEAEYTFKLGFPFTKKTIVLKDQAEERVWVSDAVPAKRGETEGGETAQALVLIVSIEPDPLRPGRQARLVVQTDPGRTLDLVIHYKSGRSQAKHLGTATADSEGKVSWQWLVSGNTTPGVWELTITADDGTKVTRHFVVQKKTS